MACECGGNRFVARQTCTLDVTVDGDNHFLRNCGSKEDEYSISDAGTPYGPYTCEQCEKVWDTLPDFVIQRTKDVEMQLIFNDKTWDIWIVTVPEQRFIDIETSAENVCEEAARIKEMLVTETLRDLLDDAGQIKRTLSSVEIYHIPDEWEEEVVHVIDLLKIRKD